MDYKKIYQMFILGTGNIDYAIKEGLGGIILFSKDILNETDTKTFIETLKNKSSIKPFVSIDQEGGRVERTENIYPKHLSAKYAYEKGEEFLIKQTNDIADKLNYLGFNLNFSPCADVNTNPNNPIIGERAFSSITEEVINGTIIVSNTYKNNNIISCIKHFPGHGDTDLDSHKALPKITLSLEELEKYHIKPFKYAINNGIDMIMAAHIHCECFDKNEIPASLSHNVINYLRNTLNFNGVIISDDMVMKGIKYSPDEACIIGINAGLNMFIYREANDISLNTIEQVIRYSEKHADFRELIDISYNKIIQLKEKYKII